MKSLIITLVIGFAGVVANAATANIETAKGYVKGNVTMVEVANSYYRTPETKLNETTLFIFLDNDERFAITKSEAARIGLTLGELYQLALSSQTQIFGKVTGVAFVGNIVIDRIRAKSDLNSQGTQ